MSEIKVLFYTAEGKWSDKIIRLLTGSKYSHCELLFPDGRLYSSVGWDAVGVRYTRQYTLANWEVVTLQLTGDRMKHLYRWCSDRVGHKYDWVGALRLVIPFVPQVEDRWFCSELCGAALKYVGVLGYHVDVHGMSPQGLYEALGKVIKKPLSS